MIVGYSSSTGNRRRKRAHPELRGTGWAQCHHPNNGDQSRLKAALVWGMVADSEMGGRAAGVCLSSALTATALLTHVYTNRLNVSGGPRNLTARPSVSKGRAGQSLSGDTWRRINAENSKRFRGNGPPR